MSAPRRPPPRLSLDCDDEHLVRAHVSRVVEPGDGRLLRAVEERGWLGIGRSLVDGTAPDAWLARQQRLGPATPDLLRAAGSQGVRVVTPLDGDWPEALDDLDLAGMGSPPCLWVRGQLPSRRAVAVVGARACTPYGVHVTTETAGGMAERGWCVVSGAAYGVDAAAHRAALATGQEGGVPPTLAMLACGVDRAYPRGHERLLARVVDRGGAVAAELPPGARPTRWRFLARNRLIAALGAGTVVVEAAARSGALNTARAAGGLGRPVGAVPGPVTAASSAGCHELLREGVAVCVCDAAHIAELIAPLDAARPTAQPLRDVGDGRDVRGEACRRLLDVLPGDSAATVDDLVAATGVPRREVGAALRVLSADGAARQSPAGWWRTPAARRGGG